MESMSRAGRSLVKVEQPHVCKRKFCQTNLQANKDARYLSKLMLGIVEGRRLVRLVTDRYLETQSHSI